jgi:putative transposase
MLPIAEVLMATQWQIQQLAGAAGLKIIECIIADDVKRPAGEQRYGGDSADGRLWGHQAGWVAFAGRKVSVEKPRVRSKQTGRELKLSNHNIMELFL